MLKFKPLMDINLTTAEKLQKNLDVNEKWFLRKPWIPNDDPSIQAELYFMKLLFKIKIATLANAIKNNSNDHELLFKACLDKYEDINLFFKNTSDLHRRATKKNMSNFNDSSPTPPINPVIDSYLASIEDSMPFSPIRSRYDRIKFPKATPKPHKTLHIPSNFFIFNEKQEDFSGLLPPDAPRNKEELSLFKTS